MVKCGVPVLRGKTVTSFDGAKSTAAELGYPVIVRVAYTLGGKGGGVAHNEIELYEIVQRGISASMVGQVLIEEYVGDWKQIEYEVMRDNADNSVIVCNMENVLSMRVHTGDNVVVAPSQTINNQEYHEMRLAALDAIRYVDIIGECNIQYALGYKIITLCSNRGKPKTLSLICSCKQGDRISASIHVCKDCPRVYTARACKQYHKKDNCLL